MASDSFKALARYYRVSKGQGFRLRDYSPEDTRGLELKDDADGLIQETIERMAELQERLYAQDRRGVLLIIQALDAAGKDSVIKHVMSGLNPQGCEVHPYKAPSTEKLDHDF